MIALSVIIPAYNEAERIVPTIEQFHEFLLRKGMTFEIIVVDDGSTDKTIVVLADLKQRLPQLSVIPLAVNKGKGNAVRTGMLAAQGSIRMFSDADGSTPVYEIDKLLKPILDGKASISIGSRYLQGSEVTKAQPRMRVVWSRLVNGFVQKMLLPGIVDPHCGFKAFTADATQQVFSRSVIDGWSFDLEVLAIARRMQLTVAEVPVKWANDERSKGRISQLPREIYSFYMIRKRLAH